MRPRQLPDPSPLTDGGRVELRLIPSDFGPGPAAPERDGAEPSFGPGPTAPERDRAEPSISSSVVAIYEARWFTPTAAFVGTAHIDARGEAQVNCSDLTAPSWLLDWTCALLRVVARDHSDGAQWPRRLTRWRKPPN